MSSDMSHRVVTAGRVAFAGFELRTLARTPSTQDLVRAAARAGAAEGYTCVAAEQTVGRGRQGRRWAAPAGTALLVSVLLRRPAAVRPLIPIAAGIAVAEAIEACCGVRGLLKWPNDVLVDGRKLAGILAEVEPAGDDAVALGIGVNVTVPSFPEGAYGVSLSELVAEPPAGDALLAAILPALRRRIDDAETSGVAALRPAWRSRAAGLGEPVSAQLGPRTVAGIALDIDDDGALLVRIGDGTVERLLAGEVHIGMTPH
jgi:BirA family biotin operon repressor/biotin-[acetyl-CoA-carboxylase] ligase